MGRAACIMAALGRRSDPHQPALGHKYRLNCAVETPEGGPNRASGVMAVPSCRSYSRGGTPAPRANAVCVVSIGARNLVALLAPDR